jgi:LEA14-like dessication related protein
VTLDKISFNGIDMLCRLDVENPNGFDIPFPEIDWELFINSASFVNGRLNNNTKLMSRRVVAVDVPFSVSYTELYNTFSSLWNTNEAAYKVALGLKFPLPLLDNKTYQLEYSGNIPMLQIPKIHPGSFRIAKIDFAGVEIDCGFTIENPNSFAIPFPNINWEYEVNGYPLIKSSLNERRDISALSQSPGNIRVSLQYADLFAVLGAYRNRPEVPSTMLVGASFIPSMEHAQSALKMPGSIPILQRPELSFGGISIKNLGLQRLDLIANWEVENKNIFALDIGKFVYDLTVNNLSWAQGAIENPPQLKANAKTTIPVDISITALPLITQIIDIINRGGGINYESLVSLGIKGDYPGLDEIDLPFNLMGTTRLVRN